MRIREDNKVLSWGLPIGTLLFILFGVACLYGRGFEPVTFTTWLFLSGIFVFFSKEVIVSHEIIATLRFGIYSYEKWDKESSSYKTYYIVSPTYLKAKFIFHYHIKDYEDTMNEAELNKYIKDLLKQEYSNWWGYKTKDEAMEYIIEYVKTILQHRKINMNVDYTNIQFTKNVEVEELIIKLNQI